MATFPATLARQQKNRAKILASRWRQYSVAKTNMLRKISALRATPLRTTLHRTSPSPWHKRIYSASPRDLSTPRHVTPHQSLSEAQTNVLREISALRTMLPRTILERDWCEAQTNILRESSALRSMRGPCTEYFPSTDGGITLLTFRWHSVYGAIAR